jgi:hypothetical protein
VTAPRNAPAAGDTSGRPARPIRFADPERNRAYWERIERNTAAAPPLSDEQKAVIRAAFHGSQQRKAA